MKIHAGVDAGTGLAHTITGTAANVHDIEETSKLIRADDEVVYGDSAYLGAQKREEFNRMNIFGRLSSAPTSGPAATKR